ncbi:developmentally Regulated MAPK Interacting protein [Schizosaccharomyces osmophilus]|uniref:Developmentally Regulated MAPK Interacting protein n=1 Tax=Schizosaccharomyces osmophilus TaxID=2545709 RepID=A0AAE9W7U0_9SCHI|nr:developmentally Regulated MAPK Interacting protein [Schizosaccharomyces osmophilus]WBW71452.1 developmentally Regulated MAPK Interacting protein [Schizosaccharomyces osmophilus]
MENWHRSHNQLELCGYRQKVVSSLYKLLATVSILDGSYTTDTTNWPTGGGYRINMGNPERAEEIYAQSEEFILTPPSD